MDPVTFSAETQATLWLTSASRSPRKRAAVGTDVFYQPIEAEKATAQDVWMIPAERKERRDLAKNLLAGNQFRNLVITIKLVRWWNPTTWPWIRRIMLTIKLGRIQNPKKHYAISERDQRLQARVTSLLDPEKLLEQRITRKERRLLKRALRAGVFSVLPEEKQAEMRNALKGWWFKTPTVTNAQVSDWFGQVHKVIGEGTDAQQEIKTKLDALERHFIVIQAATGRQQFVSLNDDGIELGAEAAAGVPDAADAEAEERRNLEGALLSALKGVERRVLGALRGLEAKRTAEGVDVEVPEDAGEEVEEDELTPQEVMDEVNAFILKKVDEPPSSQALAALLSLLGDKDIQISPQSRALITQRISREPKTADAVEQLRESLREVGRASRRKILEDIMKAAHAFINKVGGRPSSEALVELLKLLDNERIQISSQSRALLSNSDAADDKQLQQALEEVERARQGRGELLSFLEENAEAFQKSIVTLNEALLKYRVRELVGPPVPKLQKQKQAQYQDKYDKVNLLKSRLETLYNMNFGLASIAGRTIDLADIEAYCKGVVDVMNIIGEFGQLFTESFEITRGNVGPIVTGRIISRNGVPGRLQTFVNSQSAFIEAACELAYPVRS